jgi:hypothetical protein
MKTDMFFTLVLLSFLAPNAQSNDFVHSADRFLNAEIPKMEAAVVAKDRVYFSAGLARVQTFVGEHATELEKSPACTSAVTDFLIVGLCRISPPGSICDPSTFIPKWEANAAECRAIAKANSASQPTPPARLN